MTAPVHNRILGVLFAVYTGLNLLGLVIAIVMMVLMVGYMGQLAPPGDAVPMAFVTMVMIVTLALSILLLLAVAIATMTLLKGKPNARFWGIFGSIVALLSFPLGTALGIYGLWFFFSDEGRRFYLDSPMNSMMPPPPPNVWR